METRNCQNCKQNFIIEPDDFSFYEKIKVPAPTFCPECRSQRRHAWRNSLSLYSRKCDLCQKSVVSIYSPDSGITVYCNKCWWSDKWDPKDYAKDYDFSKPFLIQFRELLYKVPQMAVVNDDGIASINCEYTHDIWFAKNCYMTFSGWRIENVLYSFFITAGKNIMDTMINLAEAEYLYECINCSHGYMIKNSFFSRSCINSQFLYDCQNCSDCFMCTGLRNKRYHFQNKQYEKEEYEKILKEYKLHTFSGIERAQKEYDEFIIHYPRRYAWMKQNFDCTGDIVSYSKNTKKSFLVKRIENSKYLEFSNDNKGSYDVTMSGELEESYESVVADHSFNNFFGVFSVKSQNIQYSQHCHSSKSLFGCVSLRNAKYCVLNKEYKKEEYEEILPKIIEHMNAMPYIDQKGRGYKYGEFYPIELAPFGYNETLAMEHFPLSREEAISLGYKWQNSIQRTVGQETLTPESIPDSILDIEETILNEVLKCIDCNRNYKIVPNELILYHKMEIPIPRRCFHCRHNLRVARRNPFKLWSRSCMCEKSNHDHKEKCPVEFETSYAPDRPEIVYCEQCYQQEVN